MYSKFTLTVEEEILQKAEVYAKGENRSLSDIVAKYIKKLATEGEEPDEDYSSIVRSLRGSFKLAVDMDYKKELEKELAKKLSIVEKVFPDTDVILDFFFDRIWEKHRVGKELAYTEYFIIKQL